MYRDLGSCAHPLEVHLLELLLGGRIELSLSLQQFSVLDYSDAQRRKRRRVSAQPSEVAVIGLVTCLVA